MQGSQRTATLSASAISSLVLASSAPGAVAARPSSPKAFITPGVLLGTFGGSFIAARVDTVPLAIFFAIFMAYVSAQMLLNVKPRPSRELPGPVGMSATGLGIGGVSALVAIGGEDTLGVAAQLVETGRHDEHIDKRVRDGLVSAVAAPWSCRPE